MSNKTPFTDEELAEQKAQDDAFIAEIKAGQELLDSVPTSDTSDKEFTEAVTDALTDDDTTMDDSETPQSEEEQSTEKKVDPKAEQEDNSSNESEQTEETKMPKAAAKNKPTTHSTETPTMMKDDIIKWTGKDEDGAFKYYGKVERVYKKSVKFDTENDGSMTIKLDDGKFTVLKKLPKGVTFSADTTKTTTKSTTKSTTKASGTKKTTATATASGPTKASQALDIYKSMMKKGGEHPARKDVMQRFQDDLSMTPAGASTYCANVKKKVNEG